MKIKIGKIIYNILYYILLLKILKLKNIYEIIFNILLIKFNSKNQI